MDSTSKIPIPAAGYELFYTTSHGNQVWVHLAHGSEERNANLEIGCLLAESGEDILLLPTSDKPGTKNPDASINGEVWEFKTNYAGTSTSIHNGIKRASHQADNVLIMLTQPMLISDLENAIYDRVRQCANLLKLRIVYADILYEFNRTNIISQAFRGAIQKERGA